MVYLVTKVETPTFWVLGKHKTRNDPVSTVFCFDGNSGKKVGHNVDRYPYKLGEGVKEYPNTSKILSKWFLTFAIHVVVETEVLQTEEKVAINTSTVVRIKKEI
ncbi:hypothetical protein K435DRAFT_804060 [Dendrothele bispora CBS 962.96]|uniref:Uncharacterized protein n=1 Tax=Dendrothele bispora (strain CBS 962.96) TaxID=1314807 RepID=A0A4S8LFJ5_DENBC|nr:hypothetical protein K435DRAFT_804060 [Dendrothele bispora CBS 962.96]